MSMSLIPSSVMLIALTGRPLTVDDRTLWLPPVSTPGRLAMNADPFCVTIGRRLIWGTGMVGDPAALCVGISPAPALTVTVSSRLPSASAIFGRFDGEPATSVTL